MSNAVSDVETALAHLSEQTILCIGDVMLDEFVYGEASRLSPEAPVPVLATTRTDRIIGGAGNVARNVTTLGARCIFIGVIGSDETGEMLKALMEAHAPLMESHLIVDHARPTTRKLRFVSEHYASHLLRADWELATPISNDVQADLIKVFLNEVKRADAIVLSDYAKGALTPRVIRAVIDSARDARKPIVVDPKGADYSIYSGATLLKPNRKELADTVQRPLVNIEAVASAAVELCGRLDLEAILVTLSEDGMLLSKPGMEPVHVPSYPVRIRDVSGAGDTVVALLALALGMGATLDLAMRLANAAAAVVVGKSGTATVSIPELRSRILPAASLVSEEKIVFDWAVADERVREWRKTGHRIGFTHGWFNLLNRRQVKLLTRARASCDRLIVGLCNEASADRLKSREGLPMQDIYARADVLAAFAAVDLVVVFEQPSPLELIQRLRPSILVMGDDDTNGYVEGREIVERDGGTAILINGLPEHSPIDLGAESL